MPSSACNIQRRLDRKSTRLNSSHSQISYAVFCLKKKIGGYPHTEGLRMTERFRRTDFGHLDIAVTFDDPKAYNKAWTIRLSARLADDTEMMESVCNERPDNGQEHWIGKASDAQKTAVKVAPELLAKYVGVYKGIYGRNPRTVEVTLSDGAL